MATACTGGPPLVQVISDDVLDEALPSSLLKDWVSFADQMAVIRVVAEHELPPPTRAPEEPPPESDWVGRSVNVRIEGTLWLRPGGPVAPGSLAIRVEGWTRNTRGQAPLLFENRLRPEVGRRYLALLVRYQDGEWGMFPGCTILALDESRVVRGEVSAGKVIGPATLLVGHDVAEVAELLRAECRIPTRSRIGTCPRRSASFGSSVDCRSGHRCLRQRIQSEKRTQHPWHSLYQAPLGSGGVEKYS